MSREGEKEERRRDVESAKGRMEEKRRIYARKQPKTIIFCKVERKRERKKNPSLSLTSVP